MTRLEDMLLYHGGLMRCCIESLRLYLSEHRDEDIPSGTVIHCQWCSDKHGMVLDGNAWKWAKPLLK